MVGHFSASVHAKAVPVWDLGFEGFACKVCLPKVALLRTDCNTNVVAQGVAFGSMRFKMLYKQD